MTSGAPSPTERAAHAHVDGYREDAAAAPLSVDTSSESDGSSALLGGAHLEVPPMSPMMVPAAPPSTPSVPAPLRSADDAANVSQLELTGALHKLAVHGSLAEAVGGGEDEGAAAEAAAACAVGGGNDAGGAHEVRVFRLNKDMASPAMVESMTLGECLRMAKGAQGAVPRRGSSNLHGSAMHTPERATAFDAVSSPVSWQQSPRGEALDERLLASPTQPPCKMVVDIEAPTWDVLHMLERELLVHPLTSEDCLDGNTREKVDTYESYLFVCVQELVDDDPFAPNLGNLYMLIFADFVILMHAHASPSFDRVVERRRVEETIKARVPMTASWVMYACVDAIVDSLLPYTERLTFETDAIDELVTLLNRKDEGDVLLRMGRVKVRLAMMKKTLQPKRNVVTHLLHRSEGSRGGASGVSVYLRDVLDHVVRMLETVEYARDQLASSQNLFLAKISIEVAHASNTLGVAMKRMTVVATIILPLSLVAGLMGMNVPVPAQDDDNTAAFWTIVGLMAAAVLGSTAYFRTKGVL